MIDLTESLYTIMKSKGWSIGKASAAEVAEELIAVIQVYESLEDIKNQNHLEIERHRRELSRLEQEENKLREKCPHWDCERMEGFADSDDFVLCNICGHTQ